MSQISWSRALPPTVSEADTPDTASFLWRLRGPSLILADAVTVFACFLVAYYVRFNVNVGAFKYIRPESLGPYFKGATVLSLLWVFFIWRDGGYESGLRGIASPIVRIRSIFLAGVKAAAVHMVVSYLYRGLFPARGVYLMAGCLALASLILLRLLLRALDHDLAARGLSLRRVVVVGMDDQAQEFVTRVNHLGGTVRIGEVIAPTVSDACESDEGGTPAVRTLDSIEAIFGQRPFNKIVFSSTALDRVMSEDGRRRFIEIVNFCEMHGVSLYTLPNVTNLAVARNEVGTFSGIPLVRLRDAAIHSGYAVAKRAMDIVIALAVIVLGMPFWALIAVLIKLSSRGPALFSQVRAGIHGRSFRMYKFRSMIADAEQKLSELVDLDALDEPVFKLENDPRVTRIGSFLRRTSLDEIPQFINVLKGEMSVVGPRPEELALVEKYDPWQRRRLKAKPGITGYQQIVNRGQPNLSERIKYDLVYLKHQSLLLDLYIIAQTFLVVLRGTGVTH